MLGTADGASAKATASGAYYIVINLNERAGKMLSLHLCVVGDVCSFSNA